MANVATLEFGRVKFSTTLEPNGGC